MTVNPMPRQTGLLASLIQKQTNYQKAASATSGITASPALEKKANEIVAKILDDADEINDAIPTESQDHVVEREDYSWESGASAPSPAGSRVFPDEHDCGLTNPNITLDESQAAAVRSLATQQYGCLIGAAGTGKTTVQKYLLKELIYGEAGVKLRVLPGKQAMNIACVAFTGMAVQVMKTNLPEWMHPACKTIHALLEFEPETVENEKKGGTSRMFMPQRHQMRKLDIDVLIIDEASMVGLELWLQILAALKPGVRIYMTGDLNQLPPIIGQPIFAYALSRWHVCELTKVHRQKEAGANRIIELAHQVLNGDTNLVFDQTKGNKDWRVIYQELDKEPVRASKEIINILNQLRQRNIDPDDPASPKVYDPHADRVMTAGNGYDTTVTSAFVQQAPLNERLSYLIEPPSDEHPRIVIDAGRVQRKFSVNNRVMALKNEPPSTENRVSNGMAGNITEIKRNLDYRGDPMMFGDEEEVEQYVRSRLLADMSGSGNTTSLEDIASFELDDSDMERLEDSLAEEETVDESGHASHIITVRYDNGATRVYRSKAQVESVQLAYCSTVAKCQGSQFDTAIIICHHAQKAQLSREWLYTAITRASKRVIVLGTNYAIRYAISRQRIKGRDLKEKILRYQDLLNGEAKNAYGVKMKANIPLAIEEYDSSVSTFEVVGNGG